MNEQDFQPRDFQEMYTQATKQSFEKISQVIENLNEKRKQIKEKLNSMEAEAAKIYNDFIAELKLNPLDQVTRLYLSKKAKEMYSICERTLSHSKELFYSYLEPIDFSDSSCRTELAKKNPYGYLFNRIEKSMESNQEQFIDRFRNEINSLLSKKSLARINFLKERAEELLTNVLNPEEDPFGVYSEIFTNGIGYIRFLMKLIRDVHSPKSEKKYIGSVIMLYNPKTLVKIPFIVFSSTEKLEQKYGENVIIWDTDEKFIHSFKIMLSTLLSNVQINIRQQVTEKDISGNYEKSDKIRYEWVIQLEPNSN